VSAGRPERVLWHPPKAGVWGPIWIFGRYLLAATLPWLVGFRVAGRGHIPREGGVLVVSNHPADIDPAMLALACAPRRAQYMALSRHFTRRPLATLLFALGAFPVRVGQNDARAIRYATEQLRAGRLVIVFPEGGARWDAGLGEFQEGAGMLALTPGVTVIPTGLWGSDRVLRGWRPVGRGPVLVAFGRPLAVPQEGSRRERAAELTRRMREEIAALVEPMARAHP
jgi:1-acyl-sn-glycerol-3-phosphate acyltransferase